ncbi:MAG TPA: hypothetical protein VHW65_03000 [Gemmatimonadales bacterium]|jgi:hypothetical protein|nr:hypothetical protein [Gemmatimonadales bacterium]
MTTQATPVRIHYTETLEPDDTVLLAFADARGRRAIWGDLADDDMSAGSTATADDVFDVLLADPSAVADIHDIWFGAGAAALPVTVALRSTTVAWRPGRALLACEVTDREVLLAALVDFDFHARELEQLQREVAAAWSTLDGDRRLAFRVAPDDLKHEAAIAARVDGAFERRIRFSRLAPGTWQPSPAVTGAGRRLGEELRARAGIDDRAEALDNDLEVFEHLYEMASQRMGEFRASHGEARLEWVIIGLLVLETLALIVGMMWRPGV